MRTRALPAGRSTPTMTPVEVSLWAHATTSAAGSDFGRGASPGCELTTIGSARNGAPSVTLANLLENSPNVRCNACVRTIPKASASQNAVVPPLPSATS